MGIFGESSHIKKTEELKKAIKRVKGVSDKDKIEIRKMFRSSVLQPSGLSKKEAQSKAWGEYAKLGEATISIKGEDE